jgi:hypothetical protein
MQKLTAIVLLFISVFTGAYAQPSGFVLTREEYIETYREEAIKEMLLNKIPASITLAQAIVETASGNSPLAQYANNHFGIKCHNGWKGFSFILDDDEKNECFRKYESVQESFEDHSRFLKTRRWYAPLFELKITDYKGWAYGLKKAGYATHPKYAEMLIQVIEENKLYELDQLGVVNPNHIAKIETVQPGVENRPGRKIFRHFGKPYVIMGKDESLLAISLETGVSENDLIRYNPGQLTEGSKIVLTKETSYAKLIVRHSVIVAKRKIANSRIRLKAVYDIAKIKPRQQH